MEKHAWSRLSWLAEIAALLRGLENPDLVVLRDRSEGLQMGHAWQAMLVLLTALSLCPDELQSGHDLLPESQRLLALFARHFRDEIAQGPSPTGAAHDLAVGFMLHPSWRSRFAASIALKASA